MRDKDGITAALAFADLVAAEQARGRTVLDRLDDLARELGVHVTRQRSVRVEGLDGLARMQAAVDALAATRPPRWPACGRPRSRTSAGASACRPPTACVLRGEGIRLVVRPSGTEPKLKCYAEAVVPVPAGGRPLAAARAGPRPRGDALLDDAVALVAW